MFDNWRRTVLTMIVFKRGGSAGFSLDPKLAKPNRENQGTRSGSPAVFSSCFKYKAEGVLNA